MHASLSNGSDCLCTPRRCHEVSACRDRRRSISASQAPPAGADRPALSRARDRAGSGSSRRRQPARRLAVAAALRRRGRQGPAARQDPPPGTPPHSTRTVAEVLALTCSEPPDEVTHWTGRAVAKRIGISLRSVQRIWQEHRLQPHRIRTFKRSRDLAFAEKVEDVVGLYMDPPAYAVVLSIDEKSHVWMAPGSQAKS